MNNELKIAFDTLKEAIGQDQVMTVATRKGEGVAARTVNVYHEGEHFYFITEEDSNKYKQMKENSHVALSVDAIQITGKAELLKHPLDETNTKVAKHIENSLPNQLQRYRNKPEMRLIRVTLEHSSYILLDTGKGYVIDFQSQAAMPISMG